MLSFFVEEAIKKTRAKRRPVFFVQVGEIPVYLSYRCTVRGTPVYVPVRAFHIPVNTRSVSEALATRCCGAGGLAEDGRRPGEG